MAQVEIEIKFCSIHSSPAATHPLSLITFDKSKFFYKIIKKRRKTKLELTRTLIIIMQQVEVATVNKCDSSQSSIARRQPRS